MHSLREIGTFVGIPEDSPEFGSFSNIGLRLSGDLLAPVSSLGQNRSLRGLSGLIDMLGPITLDASLLNAGGVEPFEAVIRVGSSPGLVISTHILYSMGGRLYFYSPNYGAAGGDFSPTQLGPGTWDIVVRRSGITNAGYQRFEKSFRAFVSRAPSPPPPPAPLVRPHIDVKQSGPLNAAMYAVTGSGFLPNQVPQGITVRAVDGVNVQDWVMIFTGSDAAGKINLSLGPLDTGLLPRNAANQAILNFSATDSRRDPTSVPKNDPLWSNTVTFRY